MTRHIKSLNETIMDAAEVIAKSIRNTKKVDFHSADQEVPEEKLDITASVLDHISEHIKKSEGLYVGDQPEAYWNAAVVEAPEKVAPLHRVLPRVETTNYTAELEKLIRLGMEYPAKSGWVLRQIAGLYDINLEPKLERIDG